MSNEQTQSWIDAVARYTDDLSSLVDAIDSRLDNLRLSTIEAGPSKIEPSLLELAENLHQLETMVVRRDTLLRDDAAPPSGLTLIEKLLSTRNVDAARLARRCGEVASAVGLVQTRATALFVCHYHLHGITADLVRTLTRDGRSQVYGKTVANDGPPRGGIFDDAA